MPIPTPKLLVDGIDFGEGPRWHDGRLWYSDFYQEAVYAVSAGGARELVHGGLGDRPSGLGWLPDGSLLVVAMTGRRVLRWTGSSFAVHADLSGVATGHCNDMVVDRQGNAYVGNFGFDLDGGDPTALAALALVRPDGAVSVAAADLAFPNGTVLTPDGGTLIVGETMAARYTAFTVAADATLHDRRVWAAVPGMYPDGCTLDRDGGIWFADAGGARVVRVVEGGAVTHEVAMPMMTYACALGGAAGTTLFVLCAPDSSAGVVAGRGEGALYAVEVDVPHAGRP